MSAPCRCQSSQRTASLRGSYSTLCVALAYRYMLASYICPAVAASFVSDNRNHHVHVHTRTLKTKGVRHGGIGTVHLHMYTTTMTMFTISKYECQNSSNEQHLTAVADRFADSHIGRHPDSSMSTNRHHICPDS